MSGRTMPSSSPPPPPGSSGPIFTPPPRSSLTPVDGASPSSPAPSSSSSSSSAAAASVNLSNLATFAALSSSHAHYGSDLWDAIPAVADQSENAKGYLLRLSKFLKDKAELDKEYARGLKKLVLKLQVPDVPRVNEIPTPPAAAAQAAQAVVAAAASGTSLATTLAAAGHLSSPSKDASASAAAVAPSSPATASTAAPAVVDPRSFDRFMMAFRNLHMTLATNFEILSAKIVEQVYKPLSVHRDAHAASSKKLLADLDKYTQAYQRHLDGLLQSRAACQKACQESDAMRRKLEHASTNAAAAGSNPHAINDLIASFKSDSSTLVKRALLADAKYIQHVKSMRGFRMSTDATLSHLLDQFESMQTAKLGTCKDTLSHYLAIQNQMFASNLKNLTAVQSVLEKINAHTDTQYFILVNKTGKLPIALPEYQVFCGHPNYSKPIGTAAAGSGSANAPEDEQQAMDMSSYSSAQLGPDDSPSDFSGPGGAGGAGGIGSGINGGGLGGGSGGAGGVTSVGGTAGGLLASAKSATKGTGWGWLNSIASVLPGTQQSKTHRSMGIDHDSETMLTRGSNYYEKTNAAAAAAAGDDADDPDSSPSASRRGTTSVGGGPDGEGDDAAEEKTPERLAAEKQLSDYFDAITGRAPSGSTPSPSASSSASSKSTSPGLSGSSHESAYSASRERDLSADEIARSEALLATVEGRKAFASVLNRQRNTSGGLRLSSSSSLHRLAAWCRRFLDAAQSSMHVNPTQLVMIMSQSFFVEELAAAAPVATHSDDSFASADAAAADEDSHAASARLHRIYLISLIKDHPLWKQLRFWEEAFFDAFNSKIRKSAAARVHKWHSDLEQAESLHTRKQVCFSTLSTFAHNLLDFGLPVRAIIDFVEKLASINELEPEQMAMLRSMDAYHSDAAIAEQERLKQEEEQRDREAHQAAAAALAHAQDPSNLILGDEDGDGEAAGGEQFERVEREDNLP